MKRKCDLLNALIQAAESLVPVNAERRMEYWYRELGKTWRFLMEHEAQYMAYMREKGAPGNADLAGAGQPAGDLRNMIVVRVGYLAYAQEKLNELRSRWQNNFFMRA
jgi:hypothetical protein